MRRRDFCQGSAALAVLSACVDRTSPKVAEHLSLSSALEQMRAGTLTEEGLLRHYLERISALDRAGPELRSVIELHPAAEKALASLSRGPLQGAPVLIKDNIETADGMLTTAGSLALLNAPLPAKDAFLVRRLREAGAFIFGKTNLSEWANIRSHDSTSGWSARGGLTRNPRRPTHTASGSSSGSAAAVAAGLCAAAIGTETSGSIVSPASACGIVGLKPTLGVISRSGIIPITRWQDTAGPMTRTVRDAALLMNVLAAHDPEDEFSQEAPEPVREGFTSLFSPEALRGRRLGIARELCGQHPGVLSAFDEALKRLRQAGTEIVDDVEIPHHQAAGGLAWRAMLTEFRTDLNDYLRKRGGQVTSLAELIVFNRLHAEQEMPHFGQDLFEEAERRASLLDLAEAKAARSHASRLAGPEGMDLALQQHRLDALICPTNDPAGRIDLAKGDANTRVACVPAAVAGYPHLTVPMSEVDGLPIGLSFMGPAWSEPLLLALGDAFEKLRQL